MLQTDAEARLKMMTSWDVDPQLTQDEIDILLTDWKVPFYTPDTWNLDSAAAAGWLVKAGKCANRFNFSSDVNSFSRDQLYQHCIMQAKKYNNAMLTIEVGNRKTYDPVIGNVDYTNE